MKRWTIVAAIIVLLIPSLAAFSRGEVVHLVLDGSINPVSKDLVLRAIAQAEEEEAQLLVIELNTPGGLGESMRDIVIAELASSVPIAVFVGPAGARAASAGVLITLAADVAAMAPGTNIGAAHPVDLMGGGEEQDETMAEKSTNDAVAFAKSVAQERGRNVEWAEAAVRESSSLTALEALDQGVIDFIADDLDDLLARLDGYALPDGRTLHTIGLAVTKIQPTLREKLLNYLADPNIVYILFLLGLYGLIYEFFQPGIGFGLAAGGICLILAFLGLQILPVNTVGVALILFGTVLMVLDAFTPTNGILTTGGVISLLVGSFTLFDIQDRAIGLSWVTIVLVVGTMTALFVFIISKALLIQRKSPTIGVKSLVGMRGEAKISINPQGTVFVNGEYWKARSLEGRIPPGEDVTVVGMDGHTLLVRRTQESRSSNEAPHSTKMEKG
ncbi:MAG: nodulation protein NfeD [Candidatus Bipolaricaulota bacterium]|nr:nodulation protein NfeD [Candidatus Bipolaricaulota bacterium]